MKKLILLLPLVLLLTGCSFSSTGTISQKEPDRLEPSDGFMPCWVTGYEAEPLPYGIITSNNSAISYK